MAETKKTKSKAVTKKPRAVSAKKRAVKKTASKKAPSVSKTKSKKSARPTSSKLGIGGAREKKSPEKKPEAEVVTLPVNMSERTVEKTAVLKKEFDYHFRDSAYRISYVTGLCFLLVGATLSTLSAFGPNINHQANVTSATDPTTETLTSDNTTTVETGTVPTTDENTATVEEVTETPTNDDTTTIVAGTVPQADETVDLLAEAIGPSEVYFLDRFPDYIVDSYKVKFVATNVDIVKTYLRKVDAASFGIELPAELIADTKYQTVIPFQSISPGYYKFWVYVKPLDGSSTFGTDSDIFFVGTPELEATLYPKEDSTLVPDEPTPVTDDDTVVKTNDTDTDPVSLPVAEPVDRSYSDFSLIKPSDSTLTGIQTLRVSVPAEYTYIELYARPLNSLNSRFVALATKRLDRWIFVVNSTNLPNGKYEFFAKTKFSGEVYETEPLILSVYNEPASITKDPSTIPTPIIDIIDTLPTQRPVRPIVESRVEDVDFEPSITVEEDARRETNELIRNHSEDIRTLLENYSAARQSGDEMLIKTAKEALSEKREEIVIKTLQDERMQGLSDDIDEHLAKRIEDLQQRVDTFEKLRSEKSNGDTSKDSDNDGISDFDEVNLYGTSPEAADSDNDGVTDGIEIMRGYNPNSEVPEAVIVFESPKESIGLERDDVLVVEEVISIKDDETTVENPKVKAEIRGRGLPNSFVTLFIFSTPTVVTVRTDEDGQFVYVFDKELDDGEHDVYIAMTDNAGEIIAQSSPFSFVKEAQAFTPVDASESEVIASEAVVEPGKNTYNTVIGIGILAFGLILFMLGISLRGKNKEEEEIENDDEREADPDEDKKFEHIDAT